MAELLVSELTKITVDNIICDYGWYYDIVTMCHVDKCTNNYVKAETLARWFELRKEKRETNMTNIENIRNQAAVLLAEADRLANLPVEPDCDVIYFKKRFYNTGIYYTYAAVRIQRESWHSYKWYVSGSRSAPQDCYWQSLVEWICRPEDEWEIWTATITPLVSSDGLFSDSYDE